MSVPEANQPKRAKRRALLILIVVGGLAAGAAAILRAPARTGAGTQQPTFAVQRGPLTISIAQAGVIQALEQQIIVSEVEGQTTLIYLIEEGARVSKGDLLAELDASGLQDGLVEQQIRVQNAEAEYIRAREGLAVTKNQSDSDIALAELNLRFAKEDLLQYKEGEYKQALMSADSRITLAEEELQLAARKLEWSEKLFGESYISQSERDADRLSHNRAKLDLELARSEKKLLEDFTYTRQIAQRESDVAQTTRALERVRLKGSADIVQAEADLKAKEAEWRQQQVKEEKIRDQIAKTRIVAPRDGLVVYATSAKSSGWRGGNQEPLEAGQQVRERQELIYLPTADEMMAKIQIHESGLDKVRLGLPVVLTVDALQGRTYVGKVTRIAPLPDAASMWMNPDLKVFQTEITIEGRQPELRSGMSCMTEIIVDRYDDALYVPVQAVVRVNGQSTVYVGQEDGFRPLAVQVGLDNNRMIHVLSGVAAGQTVLLTPPLQDAAANHSEQPGAGQMDSEKMMSMIRQANAKRTNAAPVRSTEPGTNGGAAAAATTPAAPAEGRREMTPEQRAEMQRRLESMTPEQREEMMKRRNARRAEGGGGASGGGQPGGER